MKIFVQLILIFTVSVILATPAVGQEKAPKQILIKNVRIFDGTSTKLTGNTNVLVENNLIKEISRKAKAAKGATVIEAGGRVLIPGLIDTHQHLGLPVPYPHIYNNVDCMWLSIAAASEAKAMLMRGFTTVRDAGGPAIGLAQAIKQGRADGPRIYPSGPGIFKTSIHGAFRNFSPLHPNISGEEPPYLPQQYFLLADGATQVVHAAREVLQRGATQINVTIDNGTTSPSTPSHTAQYTVDEIRAAAQIAGEAGTYVMVNAIDDESVRQALEAGIVCISHGTLMSGNTMKLLKQKKGYLVPQARLFTVTETDKPAFAFLGSAALDKMLQLNDAVDHLFKLAKKYKVKIGFGTGLYGTPDDFARQSQEFECRLKWFTPVEILQQATSINAEIIALCGKQNPYTAGPLGVIVPGAYADLLIIDGNPLKDIKLLGDPEKNLKLIMKDGKVYKSTL